MADPSPGPDQLLRLLRDGWASWIHRRSYEVKLVDASEVQLLEEIEYTAPPWLGETAEGGDVFVPISSVARERNGTLAVEDGRGDRVPTLTSSEASVRLRLALLPLIEATARAHDGESMREIFDLLFGESRISASRALRLLEALDVGAPDRAALLELLGLIVDGELVFVPATPGRRQVSRLSSTTSLATDTPFWRRVLSSFGLSDTRLYIRMGSLPMAATSEIRVEVPDGVRIAEMRTWDEGSL